MVVAMADDDEKLPPPPATQDSASLFVSLYVVLLAFFILLNSMATIDKTKLEEAAESVSSAFSLKQPLTPKLIEMIPSEGADLSITQFFEQMRQVAESFVPIEELEVQTADDQMVMTFPAEALFEPGTASISEQNKHFLSELAEALLRWKQGLRVDTEFLLGYKPSRKGEETGNKLEVARAGAFARHMVSQGISSKALRPGLYQTREGTIEMTFHVRNPEATNLLVTPPKPLREGIGQ